MAETFAAVCSAIAAVASAVAAFLSFSLAKRTATQALESERRTRELQIEEIARTVKVESHGATRVYQQIKPMQDSLFTIVGGFNGSGHSEVAAATAHTTARIAAIEQQTEKLANLRKSSMPTRFNAVRHALVLTWRTGLPRKLNTCVECVPICSRITITAAALSGTAPGQQRPYRTSRTAVVRCASDPRRTSD